MLQKIEPIKKEELEGRPQVTSPQEVHTQDAHMMMPMDHKAKQRQKLGWFSFPKKLKTAVSPFPVWQFSAKLIKTVKAVLKVTQSPIKLIH